LIVFCDLRLQDRHKSGNDWYKVSWFCKVLTSFKTCLFVAFHSSYYLDKWLQLQD